MQLMDIATLFKHTYQVQLLLHCVNSLDSGHQTSYLKNQGHSYYEL